jgi:hypothetical protein
MPNGSDIIVRAGSVEVEFDSAVYPPVAPKKHKNASGKLTRVLITDDADKTIFDTGDHPSGLKYQIKAFCK